MRMGEGGTPGKGVVTAGEWSDGFVHFGPISPALPQLNSRFRRAGLLTKASNYMRLMCNALLCTRRRHQARSWSRYIQTRRVLSFSCNSYLIMLQAPHY